MKKPKGDFGTLPKEKSLTKRELLAAQEREAASRRLADGYEYWDCEARPVRVLNGQCERYVTGGTWEVDPTQEHPRLRGLDESSDYTLIRNEGDLSEVVGLYEKSKAQSRRR